MKLVKGRGPVCVRHRRPQRDCRPHLPAHRHARAEEIHGVQWRPVFARRGSPEVAARAEDERHPTTGRNRGSAVYGRYALGPARNERTGARAADRESVLVDVRVGLLAVSAGQKHRRSPRAPPLRAGGLKRAGHPLLARHALGGAAGGHRREVVVVVLPALRPPAPSACRRAESPEKSPEYWRQSVLLTTSGVPLPRCSMYAAARSSRRPAATGVAAGDESRAVVARRVDVHFAALGRGDDRHAIGGDPFTGHGSLPWPGLVRAEQRASRRLRRGHVHGATKLRAARRERKELDHAAHARRRHTNRRSRRVRPRCARSRLQGYDSRYTQPPN